MQPRAQVGGGAARVVSIRPWALGCTSRQFGDKYVKLLMLDKRPHCVSPTVLGRRGVEDDGQSHPEGPGALRHRAAPRSDILAAFHGERVR
jgi:hypothetical protein